MLDREFETQSVDPMFLEPESGLAWYDKKDNRLELVLGVQSPYEAAESVAFLLGKAKLKPARINAQFAYLGGGFGGRDHTPFPLYVALAAMFYPGKPVRLAHDRYQQFQAGIKRHAFKMRTRIGIDRATGKIRAFAADHVLDGGGLANFSASVATCGATAAIGIYDMPKVDVTTVALHSRGVTAGSMRGYGTLQTMTALEVLIDEAAAALPLDPIEFRRRNALKTGGRTMTGNPYSVSVRTDEILDKLEAHPIWQQRAEEKARAPAGMLVGTGVACVTKDYGTGADCSLGRVEIERRTAASRSIATMSRWATASAPRWPTAWRCISAASPTRCRWRRSTPSTRSGSSPRAIRYTMDQKTQDAAEKNPRWVPAISSATSASIGAHVGTHAAAEAARVIFRFGLWPAALELWGIAADRSARQGLRQGAWEDGQLILDGPRAAAAGGARRDRACAQLRHRRDGARLLALGLVARALPAAAARHWRAEIDALAVRRATASSSGSTATSVRFPPTDNNRIGVAFTSLCGTLVRVEIERATGALRIAKAYSVFECGAGAGAGGRARPGAGRLRHGRRLRAARDRCRPIEDGPGNGQWNLGQYLIARGSDLPLHDLEIEMLPPLRRTSRRRAWPRS